jgi:glycosyltransferase involved in cell wall biosynthesis
MRKPRVLLLSPWPPYPFDGGSKRVLSLCSRLRGRFRFALVTFRPEGPKGPLEAAKDIEAEHRFLNPVFERVFWFDRDPGAPASAGPLDLPGDVRRHFSRELARELPSLLRSWKADLVHAEFDLMSCYGPFLRGAPSVLTQHDAGTVSFFRSYFREMSGWGRFLRIGEWRARVRFQKAAAGFFDRIVVTTPSDRKLLLAIAGADKLRVVPTGVDLEHFRPAGPAKGGRLVFVGHYPHYPNEDAAVWFGREIFPLIRRKRPKASFLAAGSSPTPGVQRLAREVPGIELTGTVPDVRPCLAGAAVFVAPVRLGRGIKGKVLEAMAMGLPVVATSRAAEGLCVDPGRDLLLADTPGDFSAQVERVLSSPELGARLGKNSRRAVERGYGWEAMARRLEGVYRELLRACGQRAANR